MKQRNPFRRRYLAARPAIHSHALRRASSVWIFAARVLILSLPFSPATAAQQPPATSDAPGLVGEVPFTLENNLIIMEVRIGKSPAAAAAAPSLRFLLDTGASETLLGREALTENKLDLSDSALGVPSIQIKGSGDSSGVAATQLQNQVLMLGSLLLKDSVLVVPLGRDVRRFKIDGAIGGDVIGSLVTEVDYANRRVRFYTPSTFKVPDAKDNFSAVPLKQSAVDGLPSIQSDLTPFGFSATQATMCLDTGDAGCVTLYAPYVGRQKWREALPRVVPATLGGIGGRARAFSGRLNRVRLGNVVLQQPPVDFSVSEQGILAESEVDGQFGGQLFRRFTMILDYKHSMLYLRPNDSTATPFPPERYYGLHLLPPVTSDGGYRVEIVDEGSQTALAGVHAGDVLYKIDGESVDGMSYEALRTALNASGGERTLDIGSSNGAGRRTVKITPITY